MPGFDFFLLVFYLLISIAYLSFQWFVWVYLLSSISQSVVVLYCKSHLGKCSSEPSAAAPRENHHLKAFVEVKETSPFLYFVFWRKKGRRHYYEGVTQQALSSFFLSSVWQQWKTKEDLVYTGRCLLNVFVHDLASSEESRGEWWCASNTSHINLEFCSFVCISTAAILIPF